MLAGYNERVKAMDRIAWNHTASIAATIMNCHRDPKKSKAVKPKDLNPYQKEERKHLTAGKLHSMKDLIKKQNRQCPGGKK